MGRNSRQEIEPENPGDLYLGREWGDHVANAVVRVAGVPWPANVTPPMVNNAGCRFVPHVQITPTRSQLEITSEDDTLHSTHSYDDRNRTGFNIAMPFAGMNVTRPLRRPGAVRIALCR